jgi:hypothetical protein
MGRRHSSMGSYQTGRRSEGYHIVNVVNETMADALLQDSEVQSFFAGAPRQIDKQHVDDAIIRYGFTL